LTEAEMNDGPPLLEGRTETALKGLPE